MNLLTTPPLGLYIHLPWCVRKCPYCDFNSHARESLPEASYIRALAAEMESLPATVRERPIDTVFFGGGTPSLFSGAGIGRILQLVRDNLCLTKSAEITLEANPGTAEAEKFAAFREAGVNRLSIGAQSFDNRALEALGRIHQAGAITQAVIYARTAGFTRLNLDIMHGLPGQSMEGALADLQQALDLQPGHISWYQLTLEPNTTFYNRPPQLPEDEVLENIQEAGARLLQHAGYCQYEVSAWGQSEERCQHNLNYWLFGDYLGLGAGAHGKLTNPGRQCIDRLRNPRQPESYMKGPGLNRIVEPVLPSDLVIEFLLNALRLNQAIPFSLFEQRTGLPRTTLQASLAKATTDGLISQTNTGFSTTQRGFCFLNETLAYF